MVIGLFFSEVGSHLIRLSLASAPALDQIRNSLLVNGKWSARNYAEAAGAR